MSRSSPFRSGDGSPAGSPVCSFDDVVWELTQALLECVRIVGLEVHRFDLVAFVHESLLMEDVASISTRNLLEKAEAILIRRAPLTDQHVRVALGGKATDPQSLFVRRSAAEAGAPQ